MGKRSAEEAGLPQLPSSIAQTPAGTSGTGPFAVYFPSRYEPEGEVACSEWDAYKHPEKRNQYVVVARATSLVDFVGTTSNPEYSSSVPCRYALGVFSRRQGTLQVAPAEGGKVLRMEPRVRGASYAPRGTTTVIEPGQLKEANMRLVEEFGSQRRKRQLKAREAGRVEAQHVSGAQAVLGMVAQAGEAAAMTKEEVIASSLAHRNIPPHHPEATTAEEAYRIDELVPLSVRDGLEITKLFPAEDKPEYREQLRSSGMFGAGYVLTRLGLLKAAGSREAREERCRTLALLGHLLKLYSKWTMLKVGPGGVAEVAEKAKIAPSVLEGLLELFYSEEACFDGSKYLVSKEKKALMLGYILVLALKAEPGHTVEPPCLQALADELKLRVNDVVAHYRELGCADIATTSTSAEGTRTRGYRIVLMPEAAEPGKTLADYFPALKLGGKKR